MVRQPKCHRFIKALIFNILFLNEGFSTEKIPSSEFIWESDDGSKIFAYHGMDYLNFRNPSENVKENLEYLNEIAQEYAPRSLSKHVLLFNGFDQHPIRKDIDHIVSGLKDNEDCIN